MAPEILSQDRVLLAFDHPGYPSSFDFSFSVQTYFASITTAWGAGRAILQPPESLMWRVYSFQGDDLTVRVCLKFKHSVEREG